MPWSLTKRRRSLFAAGLLAFVVWTPTAVAQDGSGITPEPPRAPQTDETARRLIGLHLEARGGKQVIDQWKTLQLKGKWTEGLGEWTVTYWRALPERLRIERQRNHLGWDYLEVTAFDGRRAWTRTVKPELEAPEVLEAAGAREVSDAAWMIGALIAGESAGHVFVYEGTAKVGKQPAYVVRALLKGGGGVRYLFDQKTFHVLSYSLEEVFAGRRVVVDCLPTGLRQVEGVWIETGFEYRVNGRTYRRLEFTDIAVNTAVDPSLFNVPEQMETVLSAEGVKVQAAETGPSVPAPRPGE